MLIALATFAAVSPAMSKDPNVPLIDHNLPNRNVLMSPIWLAYHPPIRHGWPYPNCISQGLLYCFYYLLGTFQAC